MLWLRSQSDKIYFIAAFIITFGISTAFLVKSSSDLQSPVGMFFMVVLSVLVSSYFAFSIVNWWMTIWILPKSLPRMDFSDYIPDEFRTLVAIPTLLANKTQIEELLYDLEIRYLANRDENLLFALVTDFRDADEEVKSGDDELVEAADRALGTE
jgi:cyclic beta-1,2-glucan synthetase